jgi:hypothetical protein
MLGQMLLRSYHRATYLESLFSVIILQLLFTSLSHVHLCFVSKGNIIYSKIG